MGDIPNVMRDDDRFEREPGEHGGDSFVMTHLDEVEFYSILEDEFNCSGMCQPGLFFFGKNIKNGPPTETCLHHLKEYMEDVAAPYAEFGCLSAVFALLIFVCHVGLYNR